jgi:hypothetical protein
VKRKGYCVAPNQRIAVVPTMCSPLKVPKKAETERGGILQLRIFWRQSEGNDHVCRRVEKLVARFDPALFQMRAAELCGYSGRTGERWHAGDGMRGM